MQGIVFPIDAIRTSCAGRGDHRDNRRTGAIKPRKEYRNLLEPRRGVSWYRNSSMAMAKQVVGNETW